jgi:hypothetical protein
MAIEAAATHTFVTSTCADFIGQSPSLGITISRASRSSSLSEKSACSWATVSMEKRPATYRPDVPWPPEAWGRRPFAAAATSVSRLLIKRSTHAARVVRQLRGRIVAPFRRTLTPWHVPAKIAQIADLPQTKNNKLGLCQT